MTVAVALSLLALLSMGGLAGLVYWRRPPRPLWPSLFFVSATAFVWCLAELMTSSVVTDPAAYWIWIVVQYAGAMSLPATWWLFAQRFAELQGRPLPWSSRLVRQGPLWVLCVLYLALLTNPWHGCYIHVIVGEHNEYRMLWYVQAAIGYSLMLGVIGIYAWLRWALRRSPTRSQVDLVLAATVAPLVCNFLYVTRWFDPGFDTTVGGLAISGALFYLGIYRDRLFALGSISLRHLIRHETDAVLLLDPSGEILLSNPAAQRLLGEELLGRGADILSALSERLSAPGEGEEQLEPLGMAERLTAAEQPPDGHLLAFDHPTSRWLRIEATPIPGPRGQVLGTGLRLRDETALRRVIDVASEQAGALDAILGSVDQGLLVVDQAGNMIYSNRIFQEMWSLPDQVIESGEDSAALDWATRQLVDPEGFLEKVRELYVAPLAECQDEIHLKDGRIFERTSRPLLRSGRPAGRVWAFRDVTRRRQEEEERRQLELRVQQGQKLESLGIMAGGIAHDFNNLLAGIQGNAELALLDLPADSPVRHHLKDAQEAAERAADLTSQMLAYSGKAHFAVEPLDLACLVEETARLLKAVVSKKARLEYALEEVPAVEANATQLRQVVMNLITNASDALEDTEGVIRIRTGLILAGAEKLSELRLGDGLAPGRYAFVEVSDTGCGLDEDVADRIFDPFFSTKFAGRGLGLAAALGIMRGHRGAIDVNSEPGRGTTIRVLLPPTVLVAWDPPWELSLRALSDLRNPPCSAYPRLLSHVIETHLEQVGDAVVVEGVEQDLALAPVVDQTPVAQLAELVGDR